MKIKITVEHGRKILVGALILGGFFAAKLGLDSIGKEVYNRIMNNKKVVYEEGRYPVGFNGFEGPIGNQNILTIKDGKNRFVFYDEFEETNINESTFNDEVELAIIYAGKDKFKYRFGGVRSPHAHRIFVLSNELYNGTRRKIRDELEEEKRLAQEKQGLKQKDIEALLK